MTPHEFVAKWQKVTLSERSACQQHFLDLCELLGQPKPAAADPEGAWYTFERGVTKTDGGNGWADVWKKDHFAWEYKGKHKNLKDAYQQLLRYREDLDNPPLLVVCDMDRFEVHTNFTGTAKVVHAFDLSALTEPKYLEVLRNLFTDPGRMRPGITAASITEQAAALFGQLADGLRGRDVPAPQAAHFLMKLMFCLFAEDIDLLPGHVVSKILDAGKKEAKRLAPMLEQLFAAMATGGMFGADDILYFNGGLFADSTTHELKPDEIVLLSRVAAFDWSQVEPSIFGTLFERTLDPAKRSQIGAHYTSRADILTLLNPVMMAPLRREWSAVQAECEALLPKIAAEAKKQAASGKTSKKDSKPRREFDRKLIDFAERLSHATVLDPACGSGNFLYAALHLLLDLDKEVIGYAARHGLPLFPHVRPTQLHGLEINPYARELAQVVIWIGYIQWMRDNGFAPPSNPVLEPIESIEHKDAILDLSNPNTPLEPEWPTTEFIVGNPPFLGGSKIWEELGRDYQQHLWRLYDGRLPGASDLCCYWFEKARLQIERGKCSRAGLLGTQGIRGGANREVVKRLKQSGDIFFAVSDRDWILNGASVHISMIGFDDGQEKVRLLDGLCVAQIHANLCGNADVTQAKTLADNTNIAFSGTKKSGQFNIQESKAHEWLHLPNPRPQPNSDVLRPWRNGQAIAQRPDPQWIIDAGTSMSSEKFCLFETPFAHVLTHVKPDRDQNKRAVRKDRWWLHAEACPAMRRSLQSLSRYLATPRVSKHRVFIWLDSAVLCDDGIYVFARDDDYFFGILHSRPHEVWARSQGTQVRERESGFRYTPTTCFETFPFPEPTAGQREAIAAAAKELDELRQRWLNPPEWTREEVLEFPGSTDGPWARYITHADPNGQTLADQKPSDAGSVGHVADAASIRIGLVRYPRLVPKDDECAKELKKRTLTNLYNQRPTWLDHAHCKLDEAVFAAYGWTADLTDDQLLEKLLALNLARAGA